MFVGLRPLYGSLQLS